MALKVAAVNAPLPSAPEPNTRLERVHLRQEVPVERLKHHVRYRAKPPELVHILEAGPSFCSIRGVAWGSVLVIISSERGDAFPGEAGGKPGARIQKFELRHCLARHRAGSVGRPVHCGVVHQDELAISAQPGVGFEQVRHPARRCKRGQRILRRAHGVAPVRDAQNSTPAGEGWSGKKAEQEKPSANSHAVSKRERSRKSQGCPKASGVPAVSRRSGPTHVPVKSEVAFLQLPHSTCLLSWDATTSRSALQPLGRPQASNLLYHSCECLPYSISESTLLPSAAPPDPHFMFCPFDVQLDARRYSSPYLRPWTFNVGCSALSSPSSCPRSNRKSKI